MCENHKQEWTQGGKPIKVQPACKNPALPFHIYCRECFVALGGYFRRLR